MAYKWNLNGVSVDTDNVLTAAGGFVGNITIPGSGTNANFRIKSNGEAQLYNTTTEQFHSVWLSGSGENIVINISETGES